MKYKILGKQNNTDDCFVCGMMNDAGTKAAFYNCTDADGKNTLITVIDPHKRHQSYPNRMHGGVISALLDESLGRAMQMEDPEIWAVTINLSLTYRRPTPLDQTLYITSRITKVTKRTFEAEGELVLRDGTLCATATARFFIVPQDKLFGEVKLTDKNWFPVPEKLPKFFQIGN